MTEFIFPSKFKDGAGIAIQPSHISAMTEAEKGGTWIYMAGGSHAHHVRETPEEILEYISSEDSRLHFYSERRP